MDNGNQRRIGDFPPAFLPFRGLTTVPNGHRLEGCPKTVAPIRLAPSNALKVASPNGRRHFAQMQINASGERKQVPLGQTGQMVDTWPLHLRTISSRKCRLLQMRPERSAAQMRQMQRLQSPT